MHRSTRRLLPLCPVVLAIAACGGGGSEDTAVQAQAPQAESASGRPGTLDVTVKQRIAAATQTAKSDTNECAAVRPFYWEIGGGSGKLAGGSVNSDTDTTVYTASTRMNLGSASKWLYAAYVVQRKGGTLGEGDIDSLTLRSGYTNLKDCYPYHTVSTCFRYEDNELFTPEHLGRFFYDGGHMQRHAAALGLGPLDRNALATEIRSQLGAEIPINYSLAMLSGGAHASSAAIAAVLRKMINGQLTIGTMLGQPAVCTNPATCPAGEALNTPTPPEESWHYSLGHWVEDDPAVGDGAFSSPGTLGFYPWINAGRSVYGIVAREVNAGNWFGSVQCGRLIRKAWQNGVSQSFE
jgi:hypothetical protein